MGVEAFLDLRPQSSGDLTPALCFDARPAANSVDRLLAGLAVTILEHQGLGACFGDPDAVADDAGAGRTRDVGVAVDLRRFLGWWQRTDDVVREECLGDLYHSEICPYRRRSVT